MTKEARPSDLKSLEGVSWMAVTLRVDDFSLEDVEEALNDKVGEEGLVFKVLNATKSSKGALGFYVELSMEKEAEAIGDWKVVGDSIAYEVVEVEEEEEE